MKMFHAAKMLLKGKWILYCDLLFIYEYNKDNVFVICLITARVTSAWENSQ